MLPYCSWLEVCAGEGMNKARLLYVASQSVVTLRWSRANRHGSCFDPEKLKV